MSFEATGLGAVFFGRRALTLNFVAFALPWDESPPGNSGRWPGAAELRRCSISGDAPFDAIEAVRSGVLLSVLRDTDPFARGEFFSNDARLPSCPCFF
jgi:hypothetical protein